ncbi:MAG: aminotransferase class I/II-fold pyridoxal phosphate-dependent enzyme [Candidatus Binatia bacterium]
MGKGLKQTRAGRQPVKRRAATPERVERKSFRTAFLEPFRPLLEQIDAARQVNVYPFYPCVEPRSPSNGSAEARQEIVLVANDYLGLGMDGRVRDAAREAIARLGTSRCASPLAGGYTALHRTIEARLAAFLGQEAVALFASGYQANVGIISALMLRGDLIVTDLFNHASIVDGARLSGADVRVFQHNSPTHLRRVLEQHAKGRRALVIVEGIYSADGDIVCLPEICAVAHAHRALVMVDEAHSLGVLGQAGAGAAEHFGCLHEVDLIMGTMSKSLASVGGFIAADRHLVEVIRHNARSLIFSAALPPAGVAAALVALEILQAEPQRRERLWHNARRMVGGLRTQGFDTMRSETPVIPILVGDPVRTLEFTARLRDRGVLVCPAIPPMVQGHLSRIRAHVTAAHDDATIDAALTIIGDVAAAIGFHEHRPRRQPTALADAVLSAPRPVSPASPR